MVATEIKPESVDRLEKLLTSLNIKRFIVVDDQRAEGSFASQIEITANFITLCRLSPEYISEFAEFRDYEYSDLDSIRDRISGVWEELPFDRKKEIWDGTDTSLRNDIFRSEVEPEEAMDRNASRVFKEFVEQFKCTCDEMSLKEWRDKKDEVLASLETQPTLVLFDLDLRKDGGTQREGALLLREIYKEENTICGIITHQASPGSEAGLSLDICREFGLDADMVVIISKQHMDMNPEASARLASEIRGVAVRRRLVEFRGLAGQILEGSFKSTLSRIQALSPSSFEQIVFTSSREEGVWESDTYLRIFSALLRRDSSKALRGDAAHHEAIERVRVVNSHPKIRVSEVDAWDIHSEEIYESPELLNSTFMPIDLGDIFQITIDSTTRNYILLTQPCDLMLRKKGTRNYNGNTKSFPLVRIVNTKEKEKSISKELHQTAQIPYFDKEDEFYLMYSEAISLPVGILDLCALNQDGCSRFVPDASHSSLMNESLRHRAQLLGVEYKRYQENYNKIKNTTGMEQRQGLLMAFPGVGWKGLHPPKLLDNTVVFPIKRVRRLVQPRSGDLLLRFAQYHSRNAFEHDLMKGNSSDD